MNAPLQVERLLPPALGLGAGETPFPWQQELLCRLVAGQVERRIDIPTGLGKTAVMALWLLARAAGAQLPRRLFYIVDRRAVVDQATTEAMKLRDWVTANPEVANGLGLGSRPLPISTLRGQFLDNREWAADPSAPAIIVGTVDMIGSRLLFEGYACSRKMRPYFAALTGSDALYVLDEAHLVPPFEALLHSALNGGDELGAKGAERRALIPAARLMALSATSRSGSDSVFSLSAADWEHPEARRRLTAPKRLLLSGSDASQDLADQLARQAWEFCQSGQLSLRIVVYCDQRQTAAKAKAAVDKLAAAAAKTGLSTAETELFVGARRAFERQQAAEWLKGHGFLAGSTTTLTAPALLFATSAGEVGVDLDADHMVCDLVAWERMIQRLGRVNRRGRGNARIVVIVPPIPDDVATIERKLEKDRTGKEQKILQASRQIMDWRHPWELLGAMAQPGVDVSPGALADIRNMASSALNVATLKATTPAPLRPALTRPLLEAWAMTSLERHTGRPHIVPWLRGWIEGDPPQTALIWRFVLPVRDDGAPLSDAECELFFEAAPPLASERLDTETHHAVDWLLQRCAAVAKASKGDRTSLPGPEAIVAMTTSDGSDWGWYRLRELCPSDEFARKRLREDLGNKLAYASLLLDARLGGLKSGLLDATQNDMPATADAGGFDGPDSLPTVPFRVGCGEASPVETTTSWLAELTLPYATNAEGQPISWIWVMNWHDAQMAEDAQSKRRFAQLLDDHQRRAETYASELAARLGLPPEYGSMLALAAALHDEGKRSPRWQHAFHAPDGGVYAKTKGPINFALLDSYRHEFGSLPAAASDPRIQDLSPELRELALHLIAAHHGWARPLIGTGGCDDAPPSVLERRAAEVAQRFIALQDKWGPWGLAWWEMLLRAADQQASREPHGLAARAS